MKRKNVIITVLAVIVIITVTLTTALAYFTTNTEASGGYPIHLGGSTEVYERFQNWTKHVTIYSDEGSQPVFVRARAFWGSEYNGEYAANGAWRNGGDGWWYCNDILNGGEQTAELDIKLSNIPDSAVAGDSFTVVVVYETTPVLYNEDGTPYADWSVTLDSGTMEGGID